MTTRANRLMSASVLLSAWLIAGMAFGVTTVSAQSHTEVVDPFGAAPTTSRSELLDPFSDTPAPRREHAVVPQTTDLLDPFTSRARRAARYLAELLDPWAN